MIPAGSTEREVAQRRLRGREKWMLRAVLGAVVALVGAVAISFIATGRHTGGGCIDVTVPYSIGGQELYRCGVAARTTCAAVGTVDGFNGAAGAAVAAECRKAGLPVGSQPG